MAVPAPLRVPVEIRVQGGPAGGRWLRLAHEVSERGLLLGRALPEQCSGALRVRFVLPEDDAQLELAAHAVAVEQRDDAAPAERLALRFLAPDETSRARIARYVADRVPEGADGP